MTEETQVEDVKVEQESAVDQAAVDSSADKPKSLRDVISDAYDEAESQEEKSNGEEKERQGRQEVLKDTAKVSKDTLKAEPAIKPLEVWPEDVKQKFGQLPKEFQEFLVKREKDREAYFTKTSQEIAPIRKVAQSFQPFFENIKTQYNIQAEQAIAASLHTLNTLVYGTPEQKMAEWMNVAQQYGIPIGQQAKAQDEWVDPDVKALREQNAMLMQRLQKIETGFLSRQELEEHQAVQSANNEIESFINAKTETGEPVNPFASDPRVLKEMAVLTNAYKSEGIEVPPLAELYNKAIFSLPDIREKALQREKEAALKEFKTQNINKPNQAKRAASGITQQSYANGQFGKPKTTREILEQAWEDQASARV